MTYEIRARSLGEILDGAFQLYRNHFAIFLASTAIISLPALIIESLVSWVLTGAFSATPTAEWEGGNYVFVLLITTLVSLGARMLEESVLTIAIADAYLGRPVSLGSAFRRTAAVLGSLLGAGILTVVGISLGTLLFLVPGVLFTLNWLFYVQAITVEGCRASASLRRSKELTAGRRGGLGLLVLLLTLIDLAIQYGGEALIPNSVRAVPLVGALLQRFPIILVAPLKPGVFTLAYFDARVRSEAFDLEILSQGIGGDAQESASVAASAV